MGTACLLLLSTLLLSLYVFPRQNKNTQSNSQKTKEFPWECPSWLENLTTFFSPNAAWTATFSCHSEAAETSWGGGSSRQPPRVLVQADFFPQLVVDWGQAFHNMDFVVWTPSAQQCPLSEHRAHSYITDQPRKQLVMNHRGSWISAEQRTSALGNFLSVPVEKQVISNCPVESQCKDHTRQVYSAPSWLYLLPSTNAIFHTSCILSPELRRWLVVVVGVSVGAFLRRKGFDWANESCCLGTRCHEQATPAAQEYKPGVLDWALSVLGSRVLQGLLTLCAPNHV